MGLAVSALRRGFNPSKCKTEAKMAIARIKLLRNKREVVVRQMRRDIAALLASRQDDTARIRVEHVIREHNVLAANEIIELFCELVVSRLSIISKQRDCPADLREGISSLIYAAPRCSEIPELNRIRAIFEKKYGRDFVSAATDLRPDSGVNRMLIEKLSVRKPAGEVKLKIMKEIAKEYLVEWDPTESEHELLKPPEELLDGPNSFMSGSSFPVKPTLPQHDLQSIQKRSYSDKDYHCMQFKDAVLAAKAAAESAEKAASAAQAAAQLAKQSSEVDQASSFGVQSLNSSKYSDLDGQQYQPSNPSQFLAPDNPPNGQSKPTRRVSDSNSFNGQNCTSADNLNPCDLDKRKFARRHSYTASRVHSDIKFDDSDGLDSESDNENDSEMALGGHPPPSRPPPVLPPHMDHSKEKANDRDSLGLQTLNSFSRVHPKLPDYEELAARFEALKRQGN